ncbi:MAG: porin family protein [Pseudomonadota bacterium]
MGVFQHVILASLATVTAFGSASAQERITFQQVLQNPSDQQLNINYAQQRREAGDLLAAAATLERLLMNEPNWDQARLLYASVLYQLGDYQAAKREADLLEGRDLSDDALIELERFRDASIKKTGRTRVTGRVSLGLGYDENAGSQLAEDGLPEIVDQFSMVLRGRAKLEHDLSSTSELTAFVEGDAYYKQFEDSDFSEFLIANLRAGLTGETPLFDWRSNLSARTVRIGGDGYLEEIGGQVRFSRDFTPKSRGVLSLAYHGQDYSSIFGGGDNSSERDGDRFDVSASLFHSFTPKYRASFGLSYRDKTVDLATAEEFFAYQFIGVNTGFRVFWPEGSYLDTAAIYRDYDYSGERADEFLYLRGAYGLPLSCFFGDRAKAFTESLLVETAISYSDRTSNQAPFDFDSFGAEARLIYRF